MKKNKRLNLGKIRIVNFSTVNKIYGGEGSKSCGDDDCTPVFTDTKTTKSNVEECNDSIPQCATTD